VPLQTREYRGGGIGVPFATPVTIRERGLVRVRCKPETRDTLGGTALPPKLVDTGGGIGVPFATPVYAREGGCEFVVSIYVRDTHGATNGSARGNSVTPHVDRYRGGGHRRGVRDSRSCTRERMGAGESL